MQPCDMVGKTDFDFMPTDQAQKAANDDNKVMETGVPIIDHIEKLTTKDGDEKWLSVTKIPWYDDQGTIIGTMGISRDVTKRIKGEKETEKYKKVAIGQNLRMIELRDKVKDLIEEIETQESSK
jgi:PAS domain S-box-containing protein